MIAACQQAHMTSAGSLAEGLAEWMRGDDGPEAEAAGIIAAETLILYNRWLKSKFK